jgi:hypothetical protein
MNKTITLVQARGCADVLVDYAPLIDSTRGSLIICLDVLMALLDVKPPSDNYWERHNISLYPEAVTLTVSDEPIEGGYGFDIYVDDDNLGRWQALAPWPQHLQYKSGTIYDAAKREWDAMGRPRSVYVKAEVTTL